MQNKNLLASLLAASALASPMAGATTYPPGFEPEVIYQDSDYIAKSGGATKAAPAPAPAAAAPAAKADSTKYPAGFEPEVLYRDAEAIKKATGPATISSTSSSASAAPAKSTSVEQKAGNPLSENAPLIGIGVLALAGLFFWKKRSGNEAGAPAAAAPAAVAPAGRLAGETGVASYLRSTLGVTVETGVSKYLKGIQGAASAAAETGVAKYLKSLPAASSSTGGAETGVAKYLKKVG